MRIIECPNVDLISPFPSNQVGRLRSWLYCYKSIILDDSVTFSPSEAEEFLYAGLQNPSVISWGVIDKNNITNYHHPAPLVGFLSFETSSPYNGYFHVASPRSAWGKGLLDEAGRAVIDWIFNNTQVTRVSAAILDKNRPAKSLCYRLGLKRDGMFEDFVKQNGQPLAVAHFGLTRTAWSEQQENQCPVSQNLSSPSQPASSQELEPLQAPPSEPLWVESDLVETKVEQPTIPSVPSPKTKPLTNQ